jgi:hypothetical protein
MLQQLLSNIHQAQLTSQHQRCQAFRRSKQLGGSLQLGLTHVGNEKERLPVRDMGPKLE